MKVVIFAGGQGSRLSEETQLKPKPMVEIGGKPILWHIMKLYAHYGHNDFVICLGYKGHMIKEWFADYLLHNSDVTFDLAKNKMVVHTKRAEPWKVTLVDTGLNVNTATRLKMIKPFVGEEEFMLTYGDGVGNINLEKLIEFHQSHKKIATVTAVQPEGRFGSLAHGEDNVVTKFLEKLDNKDSWINGGFFVLRPAVFRYLPAKDVMWEKEPLEKLSKAKQLVSYKHRGFWKAMDTLRDKQQLEELWNKKKCPWRVWSSHEPFASAQGR